MEEFHKILEQKLVEIQSRSQKFSQRALARKLGLSSGAFSEILRRKRNITKKQAVKIADKLNLSPLERKSIGLISKLPQEPHFQLSADVFHLISDWRHYAILNLTALREFKSSASWISKRIGITPSQAEECIVRLKRLNLLEEKNGVIKRTHAKLSTSDNYRDLAIQKSHLEDLRLIESAIENLPVHQRDSTSITVTLPKLKMEKLKKMIREFEDNFMDEAEATKGDEVYRLSVHLFPLTKISEYGDQ